MILMDRAGSRAALGAAPILGMTDMTRIRTALLATALIAGGTAAQAQQDNGPSFEANVVGGLLSGLGLVDRARPPIDYRERAPLVLPRGNALPPPQDSAAARNPNWPNDPDVARARAAGVGRRRRQDDGGQGQGGEAEPRCGARLGSHAHGGSCTVGLRHRVSG